MDRDSRFDFTAISTASVCLRLTHSGRLYNLPATPELSTGLSVSSDVIYPIAYYALDYEKSSVYDASSDPDWEDKTNDLHWASSNNGGYFDDDRSKQSYRHRYVTQAYNLLTNTSRFLQEPSLGIWVAYKSTTPLTPLHSVHLTDIWLHLCSEEQCAVQKAFFPMSKKQKSNEQFSHCMLMDLDGNSYSGGFYAHLRSKSLSLNQALFHEWHDDRLWPWVHYVPASMGLKELLELVRWFAETEQGGEYAEEIAEEGRQWWATALRRENMQVYMYRLILDYRRLTDLERKATRLR